MHGYTKIVRLLLADKRTDPNVKDRFGETALIWASRNGYTQIVKLLKRAIAAKKLKPFLKSHKRKQLKRRNESINLRSLYRQKFEGKHGGLTKRNN